VKLQTKEQDLPNRGLVIKLEHNIALNHNIGINNNSGLIAVKFGQLE
jgi:hypothetical protein